MPLSDLTDPAAVNAAMDEFDRVGRTDFLRKYGFGPSRSYFIERKGKYYDSKAIAGAAYGYQYPDRGKLDAGEFSGGDSTVRSLLESLNFLVEIRETDGSAPTVGARDVQLLRQSRSRDKYSDFSDEEREAHQRVHSALRRLGKIVRDELGGSRDYVVKLTSGFHPDSGIRGGKPKDLWFGVSRKENEQGFLGNPQIFMIVSARGVEYGFSPLTHPDDFSNQEIKKKTREIANSVLQQMPAPGSSEARGLETQLTKTGKWHYRRKQRLEPNQSEFRSLEDWLSFLRSDEGARNAGGAITRYAVDNQIDEIDFVAEVQQMAELFRPLMEDIVADAPPAVAPRSLDEPEPPEDNIALPAFGELLRRFLDEFGKARSQPFQKTLTLWQSMADLKKRLEQFPAIKARPDLMVSISVGQGNWATVPWIAVLNTRITKSTQQGVYIAFLVATALDRVFLTLNQGTTNLVILSQPTLSA